MCRSNPVSRSCPNDEELLKHQIYLRDLEHQRDLENDQVITLRQQFEEFDCKLSARRALLGDDIKKLQAVSMESLMEEQKSRKYLFEEEDIERRLKSSVNLLQRQVDEEEKRKAQLQTIRTENRDLQLRNDALSRRIREYITELEPNAE